MKKIMLLNFAGNVVGNYGGAEKVLCDMANKFTELGNKVYVLCYDVKIGMPAFYLDEKVEFINLNETKQKIKPPKWKKFTRDVIRVFRQPRYKIYVNNPVQMHEYEIISRALQNQLFKIKPDIIISNELTSLCARFILQDINIPTIAMCHMDAQEMVSKLWKYQKECLEKADTVQVLLPCFKKVLDKHLKVRQIVAIPNIVAQVSTDDKVNHFIEKSEYKIVCVGGLNPNKQQHMIVEAFAGLSAKYPKWNVYLYGDINNKKYVQKIEDIIKRNNIENRVFLCGVVDGLDKVFKQTDIFAFPSQSEGFGLALTESMSYGVPSIVLQDCMATNYIVKNANAGLTCLNDARSLKIALDKLMQDKVLRAELGDNAYQGMREYSSELVYEHWGNLIEKMCYDINDSKNNNSYTNI